DERDQRRRARAELDRPPGVHARPGRCRHVRGSAARRLRGLPHAPRTAHERGLSTAVGDEGGFAPDLGSSEEAIDAVLEAAERAGHRDRGAVARDPAATELYEDGHYRFEGREEPGDGMVQYVAGLVERYPIVSVEDGLAEDDWLSWRTLTEVAGSSVQLVGDDIFVTSPGRL